MFQSGAAKTQEQKLHSRPKDYILYLSVFLSVCLSLFLAISFFHLRSYVILLSSFLISFNTNFLFLLCSLKDSLFPFCISFYRYFFLNLFASRLFREIFSVPNFLKTNFSLSTYFCFLISKIFQWPESDTRFLFR
jgi:hypothetical protein